MSNPLLGMRDAVKNAGDWLDTALEWAAMLDVGEGSFPELDETCRRLDAAQKTLATVMEPLAKQLKEAQDRYDEDADRWEAQNSQFRARQEWNGE